MASVFTDSGEISGQSLEEFGQSGRRWLTAAGVVAALVAGLTVIAAATDSALAAPPATQVDVVNPATSPALTRSVDDPGRIAYQSTAACILDSNFCGFDFPAVLKGHRLVVQHASASLNGLNPTGAQVSLNGGANGAVSSFLAPPSFQGAIQFDQPVLQYFDAGSAPSLGAVADTTLLSVSSATIFGYLLDCTTTPCAAIAP
jgi:hypothetical protein